MRFGVNVPLGRLCSWYPRASVGLESDRTHTVPIEEFEGAPSPPASSSSSVGPWIYVYAPLLVHPAPHFFVGVGPRITRNFGTVQGGPYDGSQTTYLTAEFSLGGWWGGSPETAPAPDVRPRLPRFGDKGEIVLTTATKASIAFSGYSPSTASTLSESLAPGFDVFVVDHVSLAWTHRWVTRAVRPSIRRRADAVVGKLLWTRSARRLRYSPAEACSRCGLRPKSGSEAGRRSRPRPMAPTIIAYTRSWVQASMPLLVHPGAISSGCRPTRPRSFPDGPSGFENEATTVGGSFLLGGWLQISTNTRSGHALITMRAPPRAFDRAPFDSHQPRHPCRSPRLCYGRRERISRCFSRAGPGR